MTRREENALLSWAESHSEYCEEVSSALDDCVALFAFGILCLFLWLALHLGVV